ncbi:cyclin [Colletotrichum higginsianum]|uniref:Cyclin n=2 Tax=Colletotrichum higginsianum TaxID=80884 RepID=H1VM02_COLHI|nr:Cyclin [Colletotrichum higginsianum IMI 349063]OBR08613.1 Cyclin [Colletotrichum higginsianum IMI 349063]TIC95550.1 G1/S-specific cyclin pas1 [Colletotrichum higginsianum]CCF41255.1 cyclin [Colletotrichum higginsianum]
MKYVEDDSSAFVSTYRNDTYSSSLESLTSVSSGSVWSAASSQSSTSTSPTNTSDSGSADSYSLSRSSVACDAAVRFTSLWAKQPAQQAPVALPQDLRQNPRRTSASNTRSGGPPTLVRQAERKVNFVDNLVDSSTQIVEAIWPLSSVVCRNELGSKAVLPLRTFIQETLRRSRTSYSTLQVALYYLILIKPHVPKHDFTMEQPDDKHECRALQCGRRMFLAALILASKYLQDRNYSARAWSKISGLNTAEINQNEIAFLLAVNWKLHITDEVFQRWTEIVLKYTPPSPPAPGTSAQWYAQQSSNWKMVILKLNPELDNIEGLIPMAHVNHTPRSFPRQRTMLSAARDALPATGACDLAYDSAELTPTLRSYQTPTVMEPTPATAYTPGRLAPALGLLPTPRLTPQSSGYNTPAVSGASHLVGKGSAMGLAMAQASCVTATQCLDRWSSVLNNSSPKGYCPVRRSSLATSISTASSPESMVSDSSRTSRSSSISSASSLASAPAPNLGVQARFRSAKLCSERSSLRPTIASVPEDYEENCITSSPESYTGPVGRLGDMSLDTPLAPRESELEDMVHDPANDAARALQELQNYRSDDTTPVGMSSRKRARGVSIIDASLQENVRDMLSGNYSGKQWAQSLVRPRTTHLVMNERGSPRKRVCCDNEATPGYETALHSIDGYRGPGMWDGILN